MTQPTDKPGVHPVATGGGAVAGGIAGGLAGSALAGAAVGGVTGPVGAAIGAVAGAVLGAATGNSVAEAVDPSAEDAYWRENYTTRPYAGDRTYDDYGPAYAYGVDAFGRYPDRRFEDVELELDRGWSGARRGSSLEWEIAKPATRDAWDRLSDRVERAIPGDSDRDGR